MKTATVRDLRNNFRRVAAWIENGETVSITKSGKPFARVVPHEARERKSAPKPDFLAQLRDTWGEKVFSSEEVARMREDEREDEEG